VNTLQTRIQLVRKEALSQIEQVVKTENTERLFPLSNIVKECNDLDLVITKIEVNIEKLENSLETSKTIPSSSKTIFEHSILTGDELSRKESRLQAKFFRNVLLEDLKQKSLSLDNVKSSERLYRTKHGKLVGIAYASEINHKWFLGLPSDQYHCIILLCGESKQKVLRFFLPKTFLDKYSYNFSSSGSEFKFNVFRHNNNYDIGLNHIDRVQVDNYLDYFLALD